MADATQPQLLADLSVNAADAQRFWVTNMVLVEGDLALIERMARRADVIQIASNAPIAVRQAKKAINVSTQVDLKTGYNFEIEAYNRMVPTEDRLEGVRAFNEKRKAQFKGR